MTLPDMIYIYRNVMKTPDIFKVFMLVKFAIPVAYVVSNLYGFYGGVEIVLYARNNRISPR